MYANFRRRPVSEAAALRLSTDPLRSADFIATDWAKLRYRSEFKNTWRAELGFGRDGQGARRSDDDLYRHVSEAASDERRPTRPSARHAREGSRHLAGLDVGTGSRRSARLRARAEGARIGARRQGRDRRQSELL